MYLNDFEVGMEFDIPEVVIDRERMLDFARLYDPIPIHLDDDYCKNTRFGQLIAPGVMSFMTVWAKFMENDIVGDELVAGKSTKMEWFKPVFAGDRLHGTVRITKITPRNKYNGILEITIDIHNQDGELVITDVTESVVKYKAVSEG